MSAKPTYEALEKKIQQLQNEIFRIKDSENSIRTSRDELAEIFSMSLDMLCIADINTTTFLKVNPAFPQILGYTEKQLLTHSFLDFIHPDDLQSTTKMINEKLKAGVKVINFTNRYRCADGNYRWLEWVSHPKPDSGVTISVAHDISKRKQAEAKLKENETLIRLVMDNLPIGISVNSNDVPVTFEYMNDNFPKFYRTTRKALADPDSFWESVYEEPEFRDKIKKEILDDVLSGDPNRWYWEDVPITRKGKKTTYITARNIAIPEKNLMISTVWDVTGRKEVEDALRKTKRLLEETQSITKLGGWEYNFQNERLTWTDEVYRIHGLEPGDGVVDVKKAIEFYIPEQREKVEEAFQKAVEEGISYDLELQLIRADNTPIWVRTMGQPVKEGEKIVRITGNILDITARKEAEIEREKLQSQLLQSQKMESVGRLAGGVAHDFNNILGVILGHVELALEQLNQEDPVFSDLLEIQKAAQRSANLTRQLLAFARKQTVAPQILDLNAVVSGMLNMLRRLIGEDIELVWRPGEKLWPLKMDPGQIDQILANLCVNARDAINGVGKVCIGTKNIAFDSAYCANHPDTAPGRYVQISVSDNGCGMKKEVQKRLFEPFFTTKETGKGTGLGLATVYGIVKQNLGFIDIESEVNKGTTFKIYLPRDKGTKPEPTTESPKVQKFEKKGTETVLLVEDEPAILQLYKRILERLNYRVLTANTPNEALAIAEAYSEEIHLLITDVVMPEMNGRELAQRLQLLYPNLRRLFMSGYTSNIIAHQGVLDKDVNFIQKPFSQKELADKVLEALDK